MLALVSILTICADAPVSAEPGQAGTTAVDRVGFPREYRAALKLLSISVKDEEPSVMTAYGNDLATSITSSTQLPYPYGTVIAMEFATASAMAKSSSCTMRVAAAQGRVAHIDVMRRGVASARVTARTAPANGSSRVIVRTAARWYRPQKAGHCAACHRKAGAESDFVYRLARSWAQ